MNIHPPLTAFPLALISLSYVCSICEAFGYRQLKTVARVNLLIGSIFLVAAFISGYQASEFANATFVITNAQIDRHHVVGKLSLIFLVPLLALHFYADKAKLLRIFYLIVFTFEVALLLYTGYLGGELVFSYGAGVDVV